MFSNRFLIGFTAVIAVILGGLLIFLLSQKKTEQKFSAAAPISPAPEPEQPQEDEFPLPEPTFTGAIEEELPNEFVSEVEAKRSLRKSVPVERPEFKVDFDWDEFRFIVTLKGDEASSRQAFQEWKTANYPSISDKEFLFRKSGSTGQTGE